MRHSDVNLTMNTYTDPKLLDVAGAVESLPALPLVTEQPESVTERHSLAATGTDDVVGQAGAGARPSQLVPNLVQTTGKSSILQSIVDKVAVQSSKPRSNGAVAVSACPVKQSNPLTIAVNGLVEERETGIEPATTSLGS
jgi:hypothetical protein